MEWAEGVFSGLSSGLGRKTRNYPVAGLATCHLITESSQLMPGWTQSRGVCSEQGAQREGEEEWFCCGSGAAEESDRAQLCTERKHSGLVGSGGAGGKTTQLQGG